MSAPHITEIELGKRFLPNRVMAKGQGKPVVYLHGPFGLEWNDVLDNLSTTHRVIAPSNVGSRDLDELNHLDGLHDLMLYYAELFDRLGLDHFDLIGHSFGGMVAAEYAALFPRLVRKLVLIDALGLWRDDKPVADYNYVTAEQQSMLLFSDMTNPGVLAQIAAIPGDPAERMKWALDRMDALGSTNHFLWPVPERGLRKRLDRVKAPTLIIWGEQDKIASRVYADDFAAEIADTRLCIVKEAGHMPQIEQPEVVSTAVRGFLG